MLKRKKNGDVTVTVTCTDDGTVEGELVTATINGLARSAYRYHRQATASDTNGEATFTITAKKKACNTKFMFEAGDVRKSITMGVRN